VTSERKTQGITSERGDGQMQRYRFPLAVAATSVALVAVLVLAGGLLVGSALASSPFAGPAMFWRAGPPWADGHANWMGTLPPELAGLAEVPAAQRFAHFRGAQVSLTDKDGKPLSVNVTAGTATSVSATSLTMTANDGTSRTFTLDANTTVHSRRGSGAAQSSIAANDKVVVVSLNGGTTAMKVVTVQ
jgi:hypothetical protein